MSEAPCLMGIDVGTGGVRVGLFDRQGSPAVFSAVEFATHHPRPGWAEQDPGEWWSCLARATRGALEESGVPALKYNGFGAVSAELGLSKALWLKESEPETWDRPARVGDCADWVIQRPTGEAVTSINTVSGKYYYDRDAGGFPVSLYEAVGVEDLLDKTPQQVLDLGAPVGELGKGAADAIHDPGFWGAYTDAIIGGQYTVEAGQASTGSVVAWFKDTCAGGAAAEAARRRVDPSVVLNELAAEVPVGSEGLVVLDYFQGNRSPYTDPHARGLISGLSPRNGPGHLFRAILEGICYGTELIHVERTVEPDPDRHEQHRFYMDRYTELYPRVKGVMHQVAEHVGGRLDG